MRISIEQLRKKHKDLEEAINKASKEKDHIEYVLNNFVEEQVSTFQLSMLNEPEFKFHTREQKLETVKEILRANNGPMRSGDIHRALERRGIRLKKTTHDAYMSQWSNNPDSGIKRAAMGMYALE